MQAGWPVNEIAAQMGVSRTTVYKWWARWRAEGAGGLRDRSSRPHHSPQRTPAGLERRIEQLRSTRKLGPARIGAIVGMHASTVHRVLARQGLARLSWFDRPTGRVVRRIETNRPGELVHVDIKKLSRIPPGGGWRAHGWETRHQTRSQHVGYQYVHSAIDAYSRVAYSEVLPDLTAACCIEFFAHATAWFAAHDVTIETVLTDNGSCYTSHAWAEFCEDLGIEHRRIRPHRPQTNGKVERFNRTLTEEWAYARAYRSDHQRAQALARWLHTYNHHRCHTAIDGEPPITRLNNVSGWNN
jgi:transposase InsO family protein